jgi:cytochrome c peroxidase
VKVPRIVAQLLGALSFALTCVVLLSCSKTAQPSVSLHAEQSVAELGPISVIQPPERLDPTRVAIGRRLFSETRLSANGKVSCSTCHDLTRAGVDGMARSVGVAGQPLSFNTPTVFNSALNFRQFWDGRSLTLEAQIDGPLLSPLEMGSSWSSALAGLRADPELSRQISAGYPEGVTEASVKDALATFERSLATLDAPLDRYLAGDKGALSAAAIDGYELFTSYGCAACHQGRALGGNMFQKLGVMEDYFATREHEQADLGRYNITRDEADRHVFKVPSLRNVARTAPYLHDGSVATLEEVIRVMARYQLGRDLRDSDVTALRAFLESLTGTYQGRSL